MHLGAANSTYLVMMSRYWVAVAAVSLLELFLPSRLSR